MSCRLSILLGAWLCGLMTLTACQSSFELKDPSVLQGSADLDGDGFVGAEDCDETDDTVNAGAEDLCGDDIDNDCDDAIDETATVRFLDDDGDGFGDVDGALEACEHGADYVEDASDCDDGDAAIFPGADEYCDGVDNDCDEATDELGAVDGDLFYADADEDGFGDPEATTTACSPPDGYVEDASDCDDAREDVNPDGTEVCDGETDEDCDETIDEDGAEDALTFYADVDADGFGDAESTTTACEAPSGYVDDATDCDDDEGEVNPDATEVCNGYDDDCDGDVDRDDSSLDTTSAAFWYLDSDGDGFGDEDTYQEGCEQPASDYVSNDEDCDDDDEDVNPDADELCDGSVDEDCDGDVDEDGAADAETFYADVDEDGFGDADSTTAACDVPSGYVEDDADCDDSDADVSPDGTEVCDGLVDEDCDETVDESGASDADTFYADSDGDGYGDDSSTTTACDVPTGYVDNDEDCDDSDADISPDDSEICDGVDNDCDGLVDDDDDDVDTSTGDTFYADDDGDGFGDSSSTTTACDVPSGYSANDEDCDDSDADISPDDDELCDGSVDEDCDGSVDEATAADAPTWYGDGDGDSYGDSSDTTEQCDQPSGYVSDDSDCDDGDAAINPAASEVCEGSVDEDCDGDIDEAGATGGDSYWIDDDEDGYGDENGTEVFSCDALSGYADNDADCDDTDEAINPDATEACDGTDEDCDGVSDEDFSDLDADGDADCVDATVFSDDFNDTGDGDWSYYDYSGTGAWTHDGSVLTEDDGSAVTWAYLPEIEEVDTYTISVDISWVGSDNEEAGIGWGWDGTSTDDIYYVTWLDPQSDLDWYGGGKKGRVSLWYCAVAAAVCTEEDHKDVDAVNSGSAAQTLEVVVDGADWEFFLDGTSLKDGTFSSAVAPEQVLLYSGNMAGGVEFDNFTITNP